jgi:hypothetical protein
MGFIPIRGLFADLGKPVKARLLPRAWIAGQFPDRQSLAPRSLDRSTTRPTTRAGHPSQGFAPLATPTFGLIHVPGYLFTLRLPGCCHPMHFRALERDPTYRSCQGR